MFMLVAVAVVVVASVMPASPIFTVSDAITSPCVFVKKYHTVSEFSVSNKTDSASPRFTMSPTCTLLIVGNSVFSNTDHSPFLNGYVLSSNAFTVMVLDSGEYSSR